MRRWVFALLLCTLILAGGCKRKEKIRVAQTDEEAPTGLSSVVHVADPKAAPQLLKGFYPVEQNSWRWTAGKFSVALRPPKDAAAKGATLLLKFSVPEPVIAKLKTVALSGSVAGKALSPESYTQAGEFTYSRDVDPKQLAGPAVNVEFTLDKFLPPSDSDQRELGVVVTSIGFEAK